MKFIVITEYDSFIVEADDISCAVEEAYSNHTGYDHIKAVVAVPD